MIICEIGQNFVGKIPLAKTLIKLAKENGGDLAKFQLYDTDALYEKGTDLYQQAKEAELSFDQATMLFDYGQEIGIEVFFSVFDVEKVRWCEEIGVRRYKIACRLNSDSPLLDAVARTKKPCFISYEDEYNRSWIRLCAYGTRFSNIALLYCVPEYPAQSVRFRDNFDGEAAWATGFSDHTIGIDVAKIALARGAHIIEKHFCLSHYVGVDGKWSITPEELRELKRWENVCKEVL